MQSMVVIIYCVLYFYLNLLKSCSNLKFGTFLPTHGITIYYSLNFVALWLLQIARKLLYLPVPILQITDENFQKNITHQNTQTSTDHGYNCIALFKRISLKNKFCDIKKIHLNLQISAENLIDWHNLNKKISYDIKFVCFCNAHQQSWNHVSQKHSWHSGKIEIK